MTEVQPRVAHGFDAQLVVERLLPRDSTVVSVAQPGSQRPDITAIIGGILVKFEIKSCTSPTTSVALYNCTVYKDEANPLDELVPLFTDYKFTNIDSVVLYHRMSNSTIGFPCDDGVVRSGKFPRLSITSEPQLSYIRQYVTAHIHKSGNSYLALVCKRPTPSVHVFYTGYGANVLQAPPLPVIKTSHISTYGHAPMDAMRLALKITFAPGSSLRLDL